MKIKLITMQRDESVMLEAWVRYHGYLFGFENLVVIDNGSKNNDVISLLARFSSAGVMVIRGMNASRDFDAKGAVVGEIIRELEAGAPYDFVIPLDCDELIGLWQDGFIDCSRNKIFSHFNILRRKHGCFRINSHLFNIPGDDGWYRPTPATRTFFSYGSFISIDHGFHFGVSRYGTDYTNTNLTCFHFHNKPFRDYQFFAANKLLPYVNPHDKAALLDYKGPGGHLVDFLLNDEMFYMQSFDGYFRINLPCIGDTMNALGLTNELYNGKSNSFANHAIAEKKALDWDEVIVFDADRYRRKWLDVTTAGVDPLWHYIFTGRSEGRDAG